MRFDVTEREIVGATSKLRISGCALPVMLQHFGRWLAWLNGALQLRGVALLPGRLDAARPSGFVPAAGWTLTAFHAAARSCEKNSSRAID